MTPRSRAAGPGSVLISVALIAVVLFFGAPFLWVIATSLGSGSSAALRPGEWSFDPFRNLLDEVDVGLALRNSAIVATGTMIASTMLASLAAFGLSRSRWRYRETVMYLLVLLYAIPLTATMVAVHDLAGRLELINTWRGLILAQTALTTPFLTWLLKGFYDRLPRSLDDAAALDGSGVFRSWWQILTPLAAPGILIAAGLSFVMAWSEVLLPIILISELEMNTIARQFFASASDSSGAEVAALGVFYLAPVLAVMLLLRTLIRTAVTTPDEM